MQRYVIEHIDSGQLLKAPDNFTKDPVGNYVPKLTDKTGSLKGVWNDGIEAATAQCSLLGDGYRLLKVVEKKTQSPRTPWGEHFPSVAFQANHGSAKASGAHDKHPHLRQGTLDKLQKVIDSKEASSKELGASIASLLHEQDEPTFLQSLQSLSNEYLDEFLYVLAKSGDNQAAYYIADTLLQEDALKSIRETLGDRKPEIVPVIAEEKTGFNKLPLAYAYALADRLGLEVNTEIVQTVRANHTDANAWHRIAHNPAFSGPVQEGKDYMVLDDTMTMGGTLASLRGYIESNGGHVAAISTLTGLTTHPEGARLAITPKMINKLNSKHPELDSYLNEKFGYGVDSLTQGESGHFLKAPDIKAIDERIEEAINTASHHLEAISDSVCIVTQAKDVKEQDFRRYAAHSNEQDNAEGGSKPTL